MTHSPVWEWIRSRAKLGIMGLVLTMSFSAEAADINRVPELCSKRGQCQTQQTEQINQTELKLLLYGLDTSPNLQPMLIPYLERNPVQIQSQQPSLQTTSQSGFTPPESLLGYILAAIFAVFTGGNLINGWQANRRKLDLSSPETRAQIISLVEQVVITSLLHKNTEAQASQTVQQMPMGLLLQALLSRLNEMQTRREP